MAGVCSRCELSESYKYWQEFPAIKHKFFKVMIGDFEQNLRIPKKFIECFKGRLTRECTLRGPSGNEWKVRIEKKRDDFVFSSGWESFVMDHGLKISDFLTFRYLGNSSFKVSIFDLTGCEKEGSYFAKHGSSSAGATCTSSLHAENEGFNSLIEPHEESDPSSMEGRGLAEEQDLGRAFEELNEEILRRNQQCNESRFAKGKEKKKGEPSCEEEEEETSYEGGEEWSNYSRPKKRRGSSSKAKQSQKYYVSNRRFVSTEEKKRAHDMAMSLMKLKKPSRVPMFALTMSQTNVYIGFALTIPKEWALKHMLQETHKVELKIPEDDIEIWTVGCRWTPSQCQIRAKWPTFVFENNLEEHDVCVFELVQKGKSGGERNPVFVVHIFRVVPQIVQLTVSRSVV